MRCVVNVSDTRKGNLHRKQRPPPPSQRGLALKGKKGKDVTCGQEWWPILGICALHLTHPSAHTQQWVVNKYTHREQHTPGAVGSHLCCCARGAVGGSVSCSRVSPQSWYWRWRERCTIHSHHLQSLPDLGLEPVTFGLQVPTLYPLGHDCPLKAKLETLNCKCNC